MYLDKDIDIVYISMINTLYLGEYWKARELKINKKDETTLCHEPIDFEMKYEIEHIKHVIKRIE